MWYMRNSSCAARRETSMYLLSGVQLGESTGIWVSLESLRGSVPSIFAIHKLSAPSRSLMYAIHLPSGDTLGCAS